MSGFQATTLDINPTQHYNCVKELSLAILARGRGIICCSRGNMQIMIPEFDLDGNLPPGIHLATWQEFTERFGITSYRQKLLKGLQAALESLKKGSCESVYIGGSFVTAKAEPGDFDGCWEPNGVNPYLIDPVLLNFNNGRAAQKAKYGGELFLANRKELGSGNTFLEFFQIDKETGRQKGIIKLDLRRL